VPLLIGVAQRALFAFVDWLVIAVITLIGTAASVWLIAGRWLVAGLDDITDCFGPNFLDYRLQIGYRVPIPSCHPDQKADFPFRQLDTLENAFKFRRYDYLFSAHPHASFEILCTRSPLFSIEPAPTCVLLYCTMSTGWYAPRARYNGIDSRPHATGIFGSGIQYTCPSVHPTETVSGPLPGARLRPDTRKAKGGGWSG
jgi:hypothetical protein